MSECLTLLGPVYPGDRKERRCRKPDGHTDGHAWWDDGPDDASKFISNHDRGAFGALLAEAEALGAVKLTFTVILKAPDEGKRWLTTSDYGDGGTGRFAFEHGRTGEEALRRLVEKLRE